MERRLTRSSSASRDRFLLGSAEDKAGQVRGRSSEYHALRWMTSRERGGEGAALPEVTEDLLGRLRGEALAEAGCYTAEQDQS